MAEPFLGQLLTVGFNFAPRGWALCAGQTLGIAQNSALFALLGTTFGGNGTTTFLLPNLQGRTQVGTGNGAGLPPITWGQVGGAASTTLTVANLPSHNHTATATGIQAASGKANQQGPSAGAVLAKAVDTNSAALPAIYLPAGTATDTTLGGPPNVTIGNTGGNVPIGIQPPYLGLTMIIALEGIFPSRS